MKIRALLLIGWALCLTVTSSAQSYLQDTIPETVVTATGTLHLLKDVPVQTGLEQERDTPLAESVADGGREQRILDECDGPAAAEQGEAIPHLLFEHSERLPELRLPPRERLRTDAGSPAPAHEPGLGLLHQVAQDPSGISTLPAGSAADLGLGIGKKPVDDAFKLLGHTFGFSIRYRLHHKFFHGGSLL